MEVETYRYLLSALIQVFGALIAINVVILIIRYRSVRENIPHYRRRLAELVWKTQTRDFPFFANQDIMPREKIMEFEYLLEASFVARVVAAEKKLNTEIERREEMLAKLKQRKLADVDGQELARVQFQAMREEAGVKLPQAQAENWKFDVTKRMYFGALKELRTIKRLVFTVMFFPASATLIFGFLLINAEFVQQMGLLQYVSYCAWALVLVFFVALIYHACMLFPSIELDDFMIAAQNASSSEKKKVTWWLCWLLRRVCARSKRVGDKV